MHKFEVKVYYEDTDLGGIVYHANYLKFIERARSEAVADVGIDQLEMQSDAGIVFVVRQLNAEFLQSAKFGDRIAVHTTVTNIGAATVQMVQSLHVENKQIFTADVKLVTMSKTGKPVKIPAKIRQKLSHLET